MTGINGNAGAQSRMEYLRDTADLLWPGTGLTAADPSVTMAVLPSARTPRVLAPARPRRAAASAVLRYAAQQPWKERLAGGVLAAGVRVGAWPLPSAGRDNARFSRPEHGDSLDAHLATVLGQPVLTSLALTANRANRKPVLQVFDRSGRTIAFAKVGASPLTARLATAEAAALARLGELNVVTAPTVIDIAPWHDLPVLVMSALPAFSPGRLTPALLDRAMVEVSRVAQAEFAAGTGRQAYSDALDERAAAAARTAGPALMAQWTALRDLAFAEVDAALAFGSWHGDWTSWNCAARGGRLLVWDWERFAQPAPLGFDCLHYFLNEQGRRLRKGFPVCAPIMVARAPELLAPWQLSAREARTTALLYLLDISLRYMADDQRATGGVGEVENWAIPTLTAALAHPTNRTEAR